MTKKCEACGRFCQKRNSLKWGHVYYCTECKVQYRGNKEPNNSYHNTVEQSKFSINTDEDEKQKDEGVIGRLKSGFF